MTMTAKTIVVLIAAAAHFCSGESVPREADDTCLNDDTALLQRIANQGMMNNGSIQMSKQSEQFEEHSYSSQKEGETDCTGKMYASIGRTKFGYNIYKGSPLSDRDEGWAKPVFKITYTPGTNGEVRMNGDRTMCNPDGYDVIQVSHHQVDMSTTVVGSQSEYQEELSSTASFTLSASVPGMGGGEFSMSKESKQFREANSNEKTKMARSSAHSVDYEVQTQSPPTDEHFEAELQQADSPTMWHRIFDNFGTHFVTKLSMGSRFSRTVLVKESDAKKGSETSSTTEIAGKLNAQAQQIEMEGEGSSKTGTSTKDSLSSSLGETQMSIVSKGKSIKQGAAGEDAALSWSEQAAENPDPIFLDLEILCEHPTFRGPNQDKKGACMTALGSYCTAYLSKRASVSCKKPPATDCTWDVDCDTAGEKVCKAKDSFGVLLPGAKCFDKPVCKVEFFVGYNYGRSLHMWEFREKEMRGQGMGSQMQLVPETVKNQVNSVKMSDGCKKMKLMDYDSPAPPCSEAESGYIQNWEVTHSVPSLYNGYYTSGDDDLDEDVCGLVAWVKSFDEWKTIKCQDEECTDFDAY